MPAHDTGHIALAALNVAAATMQTLVAKGLITDQEAHAILHTAKDNVAANPESAGIVAVLRDQFPASGL